MAELVVGQHPLGFEKRRVGHLRVPAQRRGGGVRDIPTGTRLGTCLVHGLDHTLGQQVIAGGIDHRLGGPVGHFGLGRPGRTGGGIGHVKRLAAVQRYGRLHKGL